MEASTRSETGLSTRKALTIGSVTKILEREFDDISISKIRYLEDQKLLSPRRTPGGYRLYSQADVERLRSILRMQRDEFLPLRVIRQELASGSERTDGGLGAGASLRRATSVEAPGGVSRLTLDEMSDQTGTHPDVIADLEEWRIVQPKQIEGVKTYNETDREIVKACGELARFGIAGRNLRALRTAADREAQLLEQVIGPALRSSNATRRKEAIENLEALAATSSSLTHLLLVRDLRKLTGEH
ncbi:MAG: MerR family transcriptional regulator [Actinomycetota bacterium]|nr:MerR family transcriptional regulator [Actinomycetota bacterium]